MRFDCNGNENRVKWTCYRQSGCSSDHLL